MGVGMIAVVAPNDARPGRPDRAAPGLLGDEPSAGGKQGPRAKTGWAAPEILRTRPNRV